MQAKPREMQQLLQWELWRHERNDPTWLPLSDRVREMCDAALARRGAQTHDSRFQAGVTAALRRLGLDVKARHAPE